MPGYIGGKGPRARWYETEETGEKESEKKTKKKG